MPEIIGYKKVINIIIDLDAEYTTNQIAKNYAGYLKDKYKEKFVLVI